MIIKTLSELVDKTGNWQHMELFKGVSKASGKLTFNLFIVDWYVNVLTINFIKLIN